MMQDCCPQTIHNRMNTAGSHRLRLFSALAGLMALAACGSYESLNTSYRFLYDYESNAFHPGYLLYHHSDDSSTLLMKMSTAELLFARADANAPFYCAARVRWTLLTDNGSALVQADSGSFVMSDSGEQPRERLMLAEKKIPLKAAPGQQLQLEITDLHRPAQFNTSIRVDKQNRFSAQHYLVRDSVTGLPLFSYHADSAQTLMIEHRRLTDASLRAWVNRTESKLPPPPFSASQPTLPALEDFIPQKVNRTDSATYVQVDPGMHFITADPARQSGITIHCTSPLFPEIRDAGQLAPPLRYITSKTEYGELEKSQYQKKMVDDFWLDCGGSKDKARDLIRIYYGRVQEANRYFSSYTEGWRTDRGMIHVVFGNPAKIYRRENSETWVYGDEGTASSLQFVFIRQDIPFTDNCFILQRDPLHKPYWERAVTAWRSGRVYGD